MDGGGEEYLSASRGYLHGLGDGAPSEPLGADKGSGESLYPAEMFAPKGHDAKSVGCSPAIPDRRNFGGTAGIAEMLLQSHEGYIDLLPALPRAWNTGSFRGLVARGAFDVSCAWENGKALRAEIKSKAGGPCRILLKGSVKSLCTEDGANAEYRIEGDRFLCFDTEKEQQYTIEFA